MEGSSRLEVCRNATKTDDGGDERRGGGGKRRAKVEGEPAPFGETFLRGGKGERERVS